MQLDELDAPVAVETVPAGQEAHAVDISIEYFPAEQLGHAEAAAIE